MWMIHIRIHKSELYWELGIHPGLVHNGVRFFFHMVPQASWLQMTLCIKLLRIITSSKLLESSLKKKKLHQHSQQKLTQYSVLQKPDKGMPQNNPPHAQNTHSIDRGDSTRRNSAIHDLTCVTGNREAGEKSYQKTYKEWKILIKYWIQGYHLWTSLKFCFDA